VVEHDARIGALVCAYLERAGYAPQWVRSGAAALDAAGRGIALVAELVSVRSGFCAWLTVSLSSVDALKMLRRSALRWSHTRSPACAGETPPMNVYGWR
jgi:DNA-binding response OmpR family regulator